VIEIVSNAIDEHKAGHGDIINVTYSKDGSCIVEDFGQGFPINTLRDDGETVLQASFDVLNTSGKFSDDGVYEGTALGLNGIGSKLTNYLSHWLTVISYRDGKMEEVQFTEGVFKKRILGSQGNHHTGTIVSWQPSEEFFTNAAIDTERLKKLFHVLTCLCPGLTINLIEKETDARISYFSKNGLNDLLNDIAGDSEILKNRLNINYENGKNKLDLVLTYTDKYSSNIISYVNTGETDAGPHITQIKTIITREMNKFFREKNWLKEKDDNLTGDDIQEGLLIAFNITAPNISYDAQTKSRIVKIDMTPFTSVISESLQSWLAANEKDIKGIADKALNARKAREAAKKARDIARNGKKKEKGLKAKMQLSSKFIDCVSKKPEERNLLLVEGLSAGSSAVEARNAKTDCIYMLRGKIISPLKTSVDKILANQEMSDIIKVIGAGFGNDFDVSKMNFDKIVMTTDADSDGADIELLLITFFFTYMKPLVESGKLYRAVTPLYIIRTGKEELYFYTEEEMENYRASHSSSSYEVLRAKGLGELNATDLHKVCFEKQRFKRITISDAEETKRLLDVLEGQAVMPRKQFIYENAKQLGFEFD
jgi:DNA gyrase/topoisomerase IV subunit B